MWEHQCSRFRATPELVTIQWAAGHFGLDDAACQRLRRRLGGSEVGQAPRPDGRSVQYLYALDAMCSAVAADRLARGTGEFAPSPSVYICRCGRRWVSAATLEAHIARDHAGVVPVAACPTVVDDAAYLAAVAGGRARSSFNRAVFPQDSEVSRV